MSKLYQAGATSQRTTILLRDATTMQGKTGLAFNTAGLAFSYRNGSGGAASVITLATQTVGGSWSSGGFVEIDAVKCPGAYQFDIPNAVLASGVTEALVQWKGTGVLDDGLDIDLTTFDPTTIDKTGFSLAATGLALPFDAANGVDNVTIRNVLQALMAMLAGKRSGLTADGTAGTALFRNLQDTKNRVTIMHDGHGNLTSVTFDLT